MSLHARNLSLILLVLTGACVEASGPDGEDGALEVGVEPSALVDPELSVHVVEAATAGLGACSDSFPSDGEIGDRGVCWCTPAAAQGTGVGGPIWGTDLYTSDSTICRAGVHAGVIGLQGGPLMVTIEAGQASYVGTLRNGVQSLGWGGWWRSFSVGFPECSDNAGCADPFAKKGSVGLFCNKPVGACEDIGVCTERPPGCKGQYDPVLGCDGKVYSNACEAAQAGVSVAGTGV